MEMPYIDFHDGSIHSLDPPTLMAMPQTFGTIFSQYVKHPEYKSVGPNGNPCEGDTSGLLGRYPVTVNEFHLIGKETERGWEQTEDVSTLLPSLKRHQQNNGIANELLRERLQDISLEALEKETGLSRNTILRARRGEKVRPQSLRQSAKYSLRPLAKVTGRALDSGLDSRNQNVMMRTVSNRSQIAQVLCIFCVALVFTIGTVQAVHSHPANSQTSHHSCSICSVPSLGPAATFVSVLPITRPVAIARFANEDFSVFRPVLSNFVRPPPAA